MNVPSTIFLEQQQGLESIARNGMAGRLARSRFLKLSGGVLFGGAVSAFLPRYSDAHCDPNGTHPCFGPPRCFPSSGCSNPEAGCCSASMNNCTSACTPSQGTGCPADGGSNHCWFCCHEGSRYKCCDCKQGNGTFCICRFRVGTCTGGGCPP